MMSRLPHRTPQEVSKVLKRNEEEKELWDKYKEAQGQFQTLVYSDTALSHDVRSAAEKIEEARKALSEFTGLKII